MEEELNVGSVVATIDLDTNKTDDTLSKIINTLQKFGSALETTLGVVDRLNTKAESLAPTIDTVSGSLQSVDAKLQATATNIDGLGSSVSIAAADLKNISPALSNAANAAQQIDTQMTAAAVATTAVSAAAPTTAAVKTVDAAMASANPAKYAAKIYNLNTQYKEQLELTNKLSGELDYLADEFYRASEKMGEGDTFDPSKLFPKESTALDKEFEKLDAIKTQLDATTAAYNNAAQAAASAANKQVTAVESVSGAQKQVVDTSKQQAGANAALDTGATALRAVSSAAGGTVSKLGYLGTELMYLKRNLKAAQTGSAMFATVLSFGVMAAVTLVSTAIATLTEREEKRKQKFEEGVENLKKYSSELQTLEQNLAVLNDNKSTTEQLTTARNNLVSTFDDLIVGYTDEGKAIIAGNEALEKRIDDLKDLNRLQREQIISDSDPTSAKDYASDKKTLKTIINNYAEVDAWLKSKNTPIISSLLDTERSASSYSDALKEQIANFEKYANAYLESGVKIKDSTTGITKCWDDLSSAQMTVAKSLKIDALDKLASGAFKDIEEAIAWINEQLSDPSFVNKYYDALLDQTQNAADETGKLVEVYEKLNSTIGTAMNGINGVQSDLSDAWEELNTNGTLFQSTVNNLIGSYPQLIEYVDTQTGALSINEGVLRTIYELQKQAQIQEFEAAKQKLQDNDGIVQSNIAVAKSEVQKYEAALLASGGGEDSWNGIMLEKAKSELKSFEDDYQTSLARINKLIEYYNNQQLDLTGKGKASTITAYQQALKKLEQQKKLGEVTQEDELAALQKYRTQYAMTADEVMDWEVRIYNLKKALQDKSIQSIDDLGSAVTEALQSEYEKQRDAEQQRIKSSISAWNEWEDKTTASIRAEMDALDALKEEQESQAAAAEYYQKSQELKLQIAYEKDDYQRAEMQKELNRLAKEEQDRLQQETVKSQKAELQLKIDNVKSIADERRAALDDELTAINDNYDELTSALSLRAQTEQIILKNSQDDIVSMITSYAPDYDAAGQTIGESLYSGIKSKVDNIYSYVESVMSSITEYQNKAKSAAVQAANDYEATYSKQQSKRSTSGQTIVVKSTNNFNTPVQSPVQTKRAIESTSTSLAAAIRRK